MAVWVGDDRAYNLPGKRMLARQLGYYYWHEPAFLTPSRRVLAVALGLDAEPGWRSATMGRAAQGINLALAKQGPLRPAFDPATGRLSWDGPPWTLPTTYRVEKRTAAGGQWTVLAAAQAEVRPVVDAVTGRATGSRMEHVDAAYDASAYAEYRITAATRVGDAQSAVIRIPVADYAGQPVYVGDGVYGRAWPGDAVYPGQSLYGGQFAGEAEYAGIATWSRLWGKGAEYASFREYAAEYAAWLDYAAWQQYEGLWADWPGGLRIYSQSWLEGPYAGVVPRIGETWEREFIGAGRWEGEGAWAGEADWRGEIAYAKDYSGAVVWEGGLPWGGVYRGGSDRIGLAAYGGEQTWEGEASWSAVAAFGGEPTNRRPERPYAGRAVTIGFVGGPDYAVHKSWPAGQHITWRGPVDAPIWVQTVTRAILSGWQGYLSPHDVQWSGLAEGEPRGGVQMAYIGTNYVIRIATFDAAGYSSDTGYTQDAQTRWASYQVFTGAPATWQKDWHGPALWSWYAGVVAYTRYQTRTVASSYRGVVVYPGIADYPGVYRGEGRYAAEYESYAEYVGPALYAGEFAGEAGYRGPAHYHGAAWAGVYGASIDEYDSLAFEDDYMGPDGYVGFDTRAHSFWAREYGGRERTYTAGDPYGGEIGFGAEYGGAAAYA